MRLITFNSKVEFEIPVQSVVSTTIIGGLVVRPDHLLNATLQLKDLIKKDAANYGLDVCCGIIPEFIKDGFSGELCAAGMYTWCMDVHFVIGKLECIVRRVFYKYN